MYAEPLKSKTGPAVQRAFKKILTKFHSPIIKLETDQVNQIIEFYFACVTLLIMRIYTTHMFLREPNSFPMQTGLKRRKSSSRKKLESTS
jgi:hypothetical protein